METLCTLAGACIYKDAVLYNCISMQARFEQGKCSVSTDLIVCMEFLFVRAVSFFSTPVSVPLNVCGYTVKRRRRRRGKQDKTGPAQIPLFKRSFGGRRWSGKVFGSLLHKALLIKVFHKPFGQQKATWHVRRTFNICFTFAKSCEIRKITFIIVPHDRRLHRTNKELL